MLTIEPFDKADDVDTIPYRLHPIDVGFDLRIHNTSVAVSADDDPLRVSYPKAGERYVVSGPQSEVIEYLRGLGFTFEVTP